nr:E3 ubiquitin-protein ligase RNF187 [Dasypus novemcinctus]
MDPRAQERKPPGSRRRRRASRKEGPSRDGFCREGLSRGILRRKGPPEQPGGAALRCQGPAAPPSARGSRRPQPRARAGAVPSRASPALAEGPVAAELEGFAAPEAAACAICQRAFRDPVRADCGHRFCRACVVQFWADEDGPFPCPECADDSWQRAAEPGRPALSLRLLALEVAAAAPARDAQASQAALQLLCRADAAPLCGACRGAAAPEPPEWTPRWRRALRGKENKGSVEVMRKDLNDARDLHGQAESAAAVWKGHVMDRRKKALSDYKKLRAFFAEEEEHFLQEAEKEAAAPENEEAYPTERFQPLLRAVSELEKKHRNLGLNMLLQ